jgi:hypothetical protein
MENSLLHDPNFLARLGTFYGVWAAVDLTVDFAIGKFLNLPHEETHLITAAMEFGRKATLLRGLVARSKHKNKEQLMRSINAIQNESKRNVFSHSYLQTSKDKVFFLERSPHGKFTASLHPFTLPEFIDHVFKFTEAGKELHVGMEIAEGELDVFTEAALKMAPKA